MTHFFDKAIQLEELKKSKNLKAGAQKKYEFIYQKYKNTLAEYITAMGHGRIEIAGANIMQSSEAVKIYHVEYHEIKTENKNATAIKIKVSKVLGDYMNALKFLLGDELASGEKWSVQAVFTQQMNNLRFVLREALQKKLIKNFVFQKNHITYTLLNDLKVRVIEPQSDLFVHIWDNENNEYSFDEGVWRNLEEVHKDANAPKNVIRWFNFQTNVFVLSKKRHNKAKRKRKEGEGENEEEDGPPREGKSRRESSPKGYGSSGSRGRGGRGAGGRGGRGRHLLTD